MRTATAFKRAGLLALYLCAGTALADERLEARRHFRNGMSRIAEGKYAEGIEQLKAAYALKPHPNVVFNIARAYLDAGQVADALEWYRRYLLFGPPDAAVVQATVGQLEASLAAAAAPPPPAQETPSLPPQDAPAAVASAQADEAPSVPDAARAQKLDALLERLERALARAETLPATAPGTPASPAAVAAAQPAHAVPSPAAFADIEAGALPYEERVVTASRRAQSSLEAPNATTVITAEDIRLSGARSVQELLRRVPGADVMTLGVGSANISLRGFNQRLANKVLVLVDGRSEYQDFLGLTVWSALPVGLEEIERIEVIRGPGSALYGANAMAGVINIITRTPGSGRPAELRAHVGSGQDTGGSFVGSGGRGALRYRASAGYDQADKWSRDFADGRPDMVSRVGDSTLGLRTARGNLATVYQLGTGVSAGASGGFTRFFTELYAPGLLRNFFFEGVTSYAKLDLDAGPVKLKGFWNHLNADAGPQYEALGQRSLATRALSNVFNLEALYSTTLRLAGEHHVNVGVEARHKRLDWDYTGPLRTEWHTAAFLQDEWRLAEPLRLVASYRVDRHPLLDGGRAGLAHSPRVSALVLPWDGHAFRASAASAFREPTFLESYTALRIPVPGVNGASAQTLGSTQLRPERLVAFELGYRGEAASAGAEWDVALYQNTVKDLIGLSALQRLPAGEAWDATSQTFLIGRSFFQNEQAEYTARGVEVGLALALLDGLGLKTSAALQRVTSDVGPREECAPCQQAPALKLFGGVTYRARSNVELGVDATYTGSTTWLEREPSAADPTAIEVLANPLAAYTVLNARVGYEPVKDRIGLALVGSHLGGTHAQHPFGNRIERRIHALLTVTP